MHLRRRGPDARLLSDLLRHGDSFACQEHAELFFQPDLIVERRLTVRRKCRHCPCQRLMLVVVGKRDQEDCPDFADLREALVIAGDVRDVVHVSDAVMQARPDAVVHLAAISHVQHAAQNQELAWDVLVQIQQPKLAGQVIQTIAVSLAAPVLHAQVVKLAQAVHVPIFRSMDNAQRT